MSVEILIKEVAFGVGAGSTKMFPGGVFLPFKSRGANGYFFVSKANFEHPEDLPHVGDIRKGSPAELVLDFEYAGNKAHYYGKLRLKEIYELTKGKDLWFANEANELAVVVNLHEDAPPSIRIQR